MKRLLIISLAMSWLCFLFNACSTSEVAGGSGMGNPPKGKVTMAFQAAAPAPALAKASVPGTGLAVDSLLVYDNNGTPFTIHKILMNIRDVIFKLPESASCTEFEDLECIFRIPGPFAADLLKGTVTPAILKKTIPAGTYNEVELALDVLVNSDTLSTSFPELTGHTLIIQGTFPYGGITGRRFTILLEIYNDLEIPSDTALVLNENDSLKWVVNLDAAKWMENINITACLDDNSIQFEPDGSLIFDSETQCEEMESIMDQNILESGSVEEDTDTLEQEGGFSG